MQPHIDPEAARQQMHQEIDAMDMEQKMGTAVVMALRVAILPAPGEDRALQIDIAKAAVKLQKAATMMKMVEMMKEAFIRGGAREDGDGGDADPKVILGEVADLMMAICDACEEEGPPVLRQLSNLIDEYKRRYPDAEAEEIQKATKSWESN